MPWLEPGGRAAEVAGEMCWRWRRLLPQQEGQRRGQVDVVELGLDQVVEVEVEQQQQQRREEVKGLEEAEMAEEGSVARTRVVAEVAVA
jgi:hypothetical protein